MKLINERYRISLEDRIKSLEDSIRSDLKTAVVVYPLFEINSTFRYRAYNLQQIMKKSARYRVVYFFPYELEKVVKYIDGIDLIILSRIEYSKELETAVRFARKKAKKVLFDIDDLLFDPDKFKYLLDKLGDFTNKPEANLDATLTIITKYYLTAKMCEGFISTNDFLGSLMEDKFKKPYRVIPNFLNEEQLSVVYGEKYSRFTIGYFSGSATHNRDFLEAWDSILKILQKYDSIDLIVVGYMTLPKSADVFIKAKRIRTVPLTDFVNLQKLYGKVHVNIAPLENYIFNNCKSDLKFFEPAIAETLTCASPSYTFKKSIKDGQTGFLCVGEQWYNAIEKIYTDSRAAKDITEAAKAYAIENYSGDKIIKQIEACFDSFLTGLKPYEANQRLENE